MNIEFIKQELLHIAPLPLYRYSFPFKIQLVNGETGKKTKYINVTKEQMQAIEAILQNIKTQEA
jgi:hypothetical protein